MNFLIKNFIFIFFYLGFCQAWALKKSSFLVKKEAKLEMGFVLTEFINLQKQFFQKPQQKGKIHVHLARMKKHISKILRLKDPSWTPHHKNYVRNRLHYLSQLLNTFNMFTPLRVKNLKFLNKELIHLAQIFGNKISISYCLADRSVWINSISKLPHIKTVFGWKKGERCGALGSVKKKIVSL